MIKANYIEVTRDGKNIKINQLQHPKVVSKFLEVLKSGIKSGIKEFCLDFSDIKASFPNALTPISGIISYFKTQGILFTVTDDSEIIKSSNLLNPIEPIDEKELLNKNVFNKVWCFSNSSQVFWILSAFLDELSKTDELEKGILPGIEWCLYEVMDNVIQHSKANTGFVMGQIHKSNKHIAFTIFDYGQGIYNSLKDSIHSPRHPIDAITLSIKEGVTRDKKIGQGNGMFGLHQIMKFNKGSLSITSNSAAYFLRDDVSKTFKNIPTISKEIGCTTLDFQLNYSNGFSIEDALNINAKPFEYVNIKVENLENDYGNVRYSLKDMASGYGTRQSGMRVRNEILNIYKESNKIIIIDFEEIAVISSSFADELIGKLVVGLGFFGFNNIIRLKNMNSLIQSIVQRSVGQRMSEAFGK